MNVDVVLTVAAVVMLLGLIGYIFIRPASASAANGGRPTWMRERLIEVCRLMFFSGLLTLLLAAGRKVLVD
jgi:hypothetical protein